MDVGLAVFVCLSSLLNYSYLLIRGKVNQVELPLIFGLVPFPKAYYYTIAGLAAAFQTIKHLINNTTSQGASSLFHVIMLLLGLAVTVFMFSHTRDILITLKKAGVNVDQFKSHGSPDPTSEVPPDDPPTMRHM